MTKDRLKWIISGIDFNLLTDWEANFVESCETHFENRADLTEKQEEILERLYREKSI